MSVGPMGITGGFAATPLAQNKAGEDRAAGQVADQSRRTEANRQAEAAAGIGRTQEEAEAHDRDADGRRLWEATDATEDKPDAPPEPPPPTASKDPSGERGQHLDLSG